MVDPEIIRTLIEMMAEHDLKEISLRDGEEEIVLKRGGTEPPDWALSCATGPQVAMMQPPVAAPQLAVASGDETSKAEAAEANEEAEWVAIKSPMVGTFFSAPNPESPSFVTEGSTVTPGTIVCILEAMKVFNEIKAEVSGTVARVLVKNEAAVEFGQPLFLVKPS